ncbi:MAG: ATP phosphoribosyltransferase regulatory subunit [Lachnospiraceae bacterium]|jgi:ATP phosphoribosyltransferase regulatory subunit|nr:ATP phosphoribosyltransferase regulatory subunit [Lachnospiraceae bacterium]
MNSLTFTPDGFRDIYSNESTIRDYCLDTINKKIASFGYETIDTPVLEYEDLFQKAGTVKSEKLFRFFDKDGKILSLRPDFTPSIARAGSLLLKNNTLPLRVKYFGKVFRNDSMLKGYLREYVQIGAECISSSDIYYDAEVINIVCECFQAINIDDFSICVSSSNLISQIINISNLSDEDAETAVEYISNKNFFGLMDFLEKNGINQEISELFAILENDITDEQGLIELYDKTSKWSKVQREIQYLIELYDILKNFNVEKHISFDLSLCNYMNYYTGVIFSGYTYGSDSAVLRGGRYDNLLFSFDSDKGAIGFAFSLDKLVQAMSRQNIDFENKKNSIYLLTDINSRNKCIDVARQLRAEGKQAIIILIPDEKNELDEIIKSLSGKKYILFKEESQNG